MKWNIVTYNKLGGNIGRSVKLERNIKRMPGAHCEVGLKILLQKSELGYLERLSIVFVKFNFVNDIMNCEVCSLKELEVEHFEIREVLRCILHTIVFHRALGLVRPKDIDSELFEITYVQCGDAELEKKIEEKINQFIGWVEKHPNKKSQICLSFYEVKNKQATWFSNKIEHLYWEQWHVNLNVHHPKTHTIKSHHSKVVVDPGVSALEERSVRRAALEASLREVLFQIIKFVNEKKDHIPPVPNAVAADIRLASFYYPSGCFYPLPLRTVIEDALSFIGFFIWHGHVQENASNWSSNYAQLT
ncbi:Autophagy-related protein 1010 [Macleaya cordata]|uniref:Autophagy-related protein 101 n=1 Tax=Macleaya cordata TaxID=56857 RepID=A0A200QJB2_MACCD|nr:Autophagy-related protein 1010 [Macleaya cordata]